MMQEKLQNMKVSLTIRQTQCDYRVFATKKKKADKRWDWIDRAFNFCKDELVGVGSR